MHTLLQGNESILKMVWTFNHQNKFITRLHTYIIFIIFFRHQPQSNVMTVNLKYRQLAMKTFVHGNWISEGFWQTGNSKRYK